LTVDRVGITKTAAVSFAANKILKSGGASGLAVFVRHGRRRGLAAGAVTASCVLAAAASFAAMGVLVAATVIVLAVAGRLTGWWMAAACGFAVYSVAMATAGCLAVRSRQFGLRLWGRAQRAKARVTRRKPCQTNSSAAADLYDALAVARGRTHWTSRVVGYSLASKALGILMIVAATTAAGVHLSVLGAIVIYAAALAAAAISFVPGGVGVVEASIGAMLVSRGASLPAAALAVALFRIFDLWLPVAAGAILGRNDLRDSRADTVAAAAAGAADDTIEFDPLQEFALQTG
jgi:uncharacterized membrane protein YbhN (UPF0104 family)